MVTIAVAWCWLFQHEKLASPGCWGHDYHKLQGAIALLFFPAKPCSEKSENIELRLLPITLGRIPQQWPRDHSQNTIVLFYFDGHRPKVRCKKLHPDFEFCCDHHESISVRIPLSRGPVAMQCEVDRSPSSDNSATKATSDLNRVALPASSLKAHTHIDVVWASGQNVTSHHIWDGIPTLCITGTVFHSEALWSLCEKSLVSVSLHIFLWTLWESHPAGQWPMRSGTRGPKQNVSRCSWIWSKLEIAGNDIQAESPFDGFRFSPKLGKDSVFEKTRWQKGPSRLKAAKHGPFSKPKTNDTKKTCLDIERLGQRFKMKGFRADRNAENITPSFQFICEDNKSWLKWRWTAGRHGVHMFKAGFQNCKTLKLHSESLPA